MVNNMNVEIQLVVHVVLRWCKTAEALVANKLTFLPSYFNKHCNFPLQTPF